MPARRAHRTASGRSGLGAVSLSLLTITSCGGDCADMSCSRGLCCPPGFGNCDGDPNNVCETNTGSDAKSCGACGAACPMNLPSCRSGHCAGVNVLLIVGEPIGYAFFRPHGL